MFLMISKLFRRIFARGTNNQVLDILGSYIADATLDLNFAKVKTLDSKVTFTRASSATYVGADGLIKTAAVDEPRFDHDPVTVKVLGC